MFKKREILYLLERDCVSSVSRKAITDYINNLLQENQKLRKQKQGRNVK